MLIEAAVHRYSAVCNSTPDDSIEAHVAFKPLMFELRIAFVRKLKEGPEANGCTLD